MHAIILNAFMLSAGMLPGGIQTDRVTGTSQQAVLRTACMLMLNGMHVPFSVNLFFFVSG